MADPTKAFMEKKKKNFDMQDITRVRKLTKENKNIETIQQKKL